MKIRYEWHDFQKDCEKICKRLTISDYDVIVGVARGGVIFATMITQITGKKELYTIGFNSYKNREQTEELIYTVPVHPDLKNKRVLLIDDIADSGKTLKKAQEILESQGNSVNIMTLHYNPRSIVTPMYYVNETTDWIIYPWEYED